MASINPSAIGATLGEYTREFYLEGSKQVFAGLQSVEALGIALEEGIHDEQERVMPYMTSILKQGNLEFVAATGVMQFAPQRWKVNPWQIDLSFTRAELANYLRKFEANASRQPYETIFEAYLINLAEKRLLDDMETAIWQGQLAANSVAGQPQPLGVTDGFLRQIALGIVATTITTVATGAITSANAVARFEQMWESLPAEVQNNESVIYCSPAIARMFYKNYRDLYNESLPYEVLHNSLKQTGQDGGNPQPTVYSRMFALPLSGGSCMIKPTIKLQGSGRVILDAAKNLCVGVGEGSDNLDVTVEYDRRRVHIMFSGSVGTHIGQPKLGTQDLLIVNDQV